MYHYSLKSTRELKAVADTMGISALKRGQVQGTRWLPHVSRALKSLLKPAKGDPHSDPGQYDAILQHMEHLASQNADIKGRAKYVAAAMKEINFVVFCHFLADLFSILETVSLKFQQNDLIVPSAVSVLRETYANVSVFPKRAAPGCWLESLEKVAKKSDDKALFQAVTLTRCLPKQQSRTKNSSNLRKKLKKQRYCASKDFRNDSATCLMPHPHVHSKHYCSGYAYFQC